MNFLNKLSSDQEFMEKFNSFLFQYGKEGLENAMEKYSELQHAYICKTKKTVSRINMDSIFYIEIWEHHIVVHTDTETFTKYGTLTKELAKLAPYGFIRCNQSTIAPVNKIAHIHHNNIILKNGVQIHMSRGCAPKVLAAYANATKL